jgi:hypothetical protein
MKKTKLEALKEYIELQANDHGLWFEAEYVSEVYLQQELRRVAWLIEEASVDEIRIEIKKLLERMP